MTVRIRNGRYTIDFRHDGTRYRLAVPATHQSRRRATAYERQVRADLDRGIKPGVSQNAPTIREYVQTYLADQTAKNKPSTVSRKTTALRTWIVPVLGARRLDKVSSADFTQLRNAMAKAGRRPGTVNNILVTLTHLVRWWADQHDQLCPRFKPGLVKLPRTKAKFWTQGELGELLAAARTLGSMHAAVVLLGADAGLRVGEMAGLRWADISAGGRPQLIVRRTIWKDQVTPPKSGADRPVPLRPRLVAALQAVPRTEPQVFAGRSPDNLTTMVYQACRYADLPKSGPHKLRHTFCSHLAAAGVPVDTIRRLAGHANISTTQRYMHLAPNALESAIAALDGHIVGTEDP